MHLSSVRRAFAPFAALALITAGTIATPVAASAAVTADAPLLIDEVYGGGGNSNAPFNRDFVEIVNVSAAPITTDGWSVQYSSATGATWQVTPLAGHTIPAGGTLLVGQAFGANTTLPTFNADVDGKLALSGTAGKVALVSSTTALLGATGASTRGDVVDFVGWGNASEWAGSAAAPATTNATAITRTAHKSTVDNAADFTLAVPTPKGLNTTPVTPEPEPEPTEAIGATIAEVQGTGDVTPYLDKTVRVAGYVTARYDTGGLNGFVIQTGGTGGAAAFEMHTASDAIFIYAPALLGSAGKGDYIEVVGTATEFYGLTQIVAKTIEKIPSVDVPPAPLPLTLPANPADREPFESMLILPQGPYTVADTYATNQYGEVTLATGTSPLRQPTDVARPGTGEYDAVVKDNAARSIVLDDGATTNFLQAANSSLTPPYISLTEPVRTGAAVQFNEPVILDWRNNAWKFNPTQQVLGDGSGQDGVSFANTRTSAPAPVGGDVSVASFNVLNYFTTLGDQNPSCRPYNDRAGNPITVNTGCPQRGAWNDASFQRQQSKIVSAIEGLDASVVGLMEIENSAKLGEKTDEALGSLVAALNAKAGTQKWAFVPSASNLPDVSQQDSITNAIIYQPAKVSTVGSAVTLADQSASNQAFGNAREPLAQAFRPADNGKPFVVVVNHFKSKGSVGPWPGDVDKNDGQGANNESRVKQATALRDWIATDPTKAGTEDTYLVGDFNSYGYEDPMQVLYDAGFSNAEHAFNLKERTYVFRGLTGSLDHVLLSKSALARSTGAAVWQINSVESLALEYSRYNSHGTLFFAPDAYRSSDHDPLKVGLRTEAAAPALEVHVTTTTRCTGGRLILTSTAHNASSVAVKATLDTGYGKKSFDGIAPGTSASFSSVVSGGTASGTTKWFASGTVNSAEVTSTGTATYSGTCK